MRLREALAHMASPWDWKSRGRVMALVVVLASLTAWGVVSAFVGTDWVLGSVILAGMNGLVCWLLFLRPSMRSLQRWDRSHAEGQDARA